MNRPNNRDTISFVFPRVRIRLFSAVRFLSTVGKSAARLLIGRRRATNERTFRDTLVRFRVDGNTKRNETTTSERFHVGEFREETPWSKFIFTYQRFGIEIFENRPTNNSSRGWIQRLFGLVVRLE